MSKKSEKHDWRCDFNFDHLLDRTFNVPDVCDDEDEFITVREYFRRMMTQLWEQQEGFSGKRPFGNSGWNRDLERALMKYGIMPGDPVYDDLEEDEDQEYVATVDSDEFVTQLIAHL